MTFAQLRADHHQPTRHRSSGLRSGWREQAAQVGEHRADALRDQAGQGFLERVAVKPQDLKIGEPTGLGWQVPQLIARQVQVEEVGELAHPIGQRRQLVAGHPESLEAGELADLGGQRPQLVSRDQQRFEVGELANEWGSSVSWLPDRSRKVRLVS